MGDFNEYILRHIYRWFFSKLGLRDLITEKHWEEGSGTTVSKNRKTPLMESGGLQVSLPPDADTSLYHYIGPYNDIG